MNFITAIKYCHDNDIARERFKNSFTIRMDNYGQKLIKSYVSKWIQGEEYTPTVEDILADDWTIIKGDE
jgi:hypothetical protein